jgi:hypothetical protein
MRKSKANINIMIEEDSQDSSGSEESKSSNLKKSQVKTIDSKHRPSLLPQTDAHLKA